MLVALALWLPQPLTLAITIQRRASSPISSLSSHNIILSLTLHTLHHSPLLILYNQQLKHTSRQSLPFDLPQYLDNMRVLSLIAAAAATAPLAVSAAGTLGYALGARHSGKDVLKFQHEVVEADCSSRWVL